MYAPRRSNWLVIACIIWLASIPLINIHHDATVHPMGEAGHHADHHHESEHSSSHVIELICDGWHGYIDSPPLATVSSATSRSVFTNIPVQADVEAARNGQQLTPNTRAPPHLLS